MNDLNGPMQGPANPPGPRKPYDFTRFDRLMAEIQEWRNDDQEDNKLLYRTYVIEIIEGVKALRAECGALRHERDLARKAMVRLVPDGGAASGDLSAARPGNTQRT